MSTKEETWKALIDPGPIIDGYGDKRWYNKNGVLHRDHGPAIIYTTGAAFYYKNGKCHRVDGPAVTWTRGGGETQSEYWLNDTQVTREEWYEQRQNYR